MFECQICGVLSLGGTSCPACGSQLRKDLSLEDGEGESLPTEVPGLDDAAAAWYDFEGIEPPQEGEVQPSAPSNKPIGSLPFGFQGESNTFDSQLPFGIGSFAEGIPFEASDERPEDAAHETSVSQGVQDPSSPASASEPRQQPNDVRTPELDVDGATPADEPPRGVEPPQAPTPCLLYTSPSPRDY